MIGIKFKCQIKPNERKQIEQESSKLTEDYQTKRKKQLSQKIWERNTNDELLQSINPNLNNPKRQMLGNYSKNFQQSDLKDNSISKENRNFNNKAQSHSIIGFSAEINKNPDNRNSTNSGLLVSSKSAKVLDNIVKSSQKGYFSKALGIISKRKKEEENCQVEKKESIFSTVEKANEIYLIEVTTKMIHEEIERLKKCEIEKTLSIKNIEKGKESEFAKFRENFEKVKRMTDLTIEQSAEISHKKSLLTKEIKSKSQIQGILKHDTKKLEELTLYYSKLKNFIYSVSPDWFKEKKTKEVFGKKSTISSRNKNKTDEQTHAKLSEYE